MSEAKRPQKPARQQHHFGQPPGEKANLPNGHQKRAVPGGPKSVPVVPHPNARKKEI